MKKPYEKRPIPFVRKLCAHLSEKEIEEAEERLRQYIRFAFRIHGKRRADKKDQNIDN